MPREVRAGSKDPHTLNAPSDHKSSCVVLSESNPLWRLAPRVKQSHHLIRDSLGHEDTLPGTPPRGYPPSGCGQFAVMPGHR